MSDPTDLSPVKEKKPRRPRGRPVAETLLSTEQAAKLKSVSRKSVWQAIQEGRLPADRFGARWVLRKKDVEAWEPTGSHRYDRGGGGE